MHQAVSQMPGGLKQWIQCRLYWKWPLYSNDKMDLLECIVILWCMCEEMLDVGACDYLCVM